MIAERVFGQSFGVPMRVITFAVRDTGIGIPKDRFDRLFKVFSHVDVSTTRRYGGTRPPCHRPLPATLRAYPIAALLWSGSALDEGGS